MHRTRATLIVAVTLFVASPAAAYDLAASSSGATVHWDTDVTFTLALEPGPAELDAEAATLAAISAAATWQGAFTDSAIAVSIAGQPATAMPHDSADGINTIRWAMQADDPDREIGLLARTFVVYRVSDGSLVDTDIVLDAADFTWTTDPAGCENEYDLESALTHEVGHALGFAHSIGHPEATMYATGDACEIGKRDLEADDVAGLAELYAPPASGGCSTGGSGGLGAGLLVLAAVFARRRRACAIVGATLALATTANAAQLRRLELTELTEHAVMVVRGHVTASHVVRSPGLETDATIVVDECLAGSCPRVVTVRRHGGELDGVGLRVEGEAHLDVGTEVVVFLRVDREQRARVVGSVQGAFRIDRSTGTAIAVRDLREHRVKTASGWQAGERETFDLATLRARL